MTSLFTENKIDEIINTEEDQKNSQSSTTKYYLKLKRRRGRCKLDDDDEPLLEKQNKKIKNNFNSTKVKNVVKKDRKNKEKIISTIKFQDFSKNVFSIIITYLRIDDILKLKNIGSHNIRLYISELLDLMKENSNYLSLNKINSVENPFINDYDSTLCKNYFLQNSDLNYISTIIPKSKADSKIKYILYHQQTKKFYFLIRHEFYDYFCSTENETNNENGKIYKEWKKNVIFILPYKDYYEKFQFLDEYKKSEVVIFSMFKILFFNISEKRKDLCIYLDSSSDYVLYKKELKLLIATTKQSEIEIFKVNSWKTNIKNSIKRIKMDENNCENVTILNINDYTKNNKNKNNLICCYCKGGKKLVLFDCKSMEIVKIIVSESVLIKVNINCQFLIVITEDKLINYFSIDNNEFPFINSFNLNKICKPNEINYISLLDTNYLENMFIMLIQNSNKKEIKTSLLYLENNQNNNFYFSIAPLKNKINDFFYDVQFIFTSINNEKNKDINSLKMKLLTCENKQDMNKKCIITQEFSVNI